MKNQFILILLLLGVAMGGYAQMSINQMEPEPKPFAVAILEMAEKEYDFGEIERGIPVMHRFEFINAGDAPLIISKVNTTCGCTASDFSKEAVAPGDIGYVDVTYNAAKEGVFNKNLKIVSNGGDISFSVKGRVK